MSKFYFIGKAPLSKSLLNRALIIKSWFSDFNIQGTSNCEDILIMKKAIEDFKKKRECYCGLSGTAFRFLAVRMSREKGQFLLNGEKALWNRPMEEISTLLSQLSVDIQKTDKGFLISSDGWKIQGDCIHVPSQITSQYASALALNSWNFNQDLYFSINKKNVSYLHFEMTVNFLKQLGLTIQKREQEFFIPKKQFLKENTYSPEQDKSCLFALAGFSVLNGQAVFLDWEENSLQPDNIFPEILKRMGVPIKHKNKQLLISKYTHLKPIQIHLNNFPDLFPILCILCAKAEGLSKLLGLSHLAFKESNRLSKIKELLDCCGISTQIQEDKFFIQGKKIWPEVSPFIFDTAKDHRMVMAGELVASLGVPITVKGKSSVNKSFPEFHSLISTARSQLV